MTDPKQATKPVSAKSERRLPALAVSKGIGIGRVVFLHQEKTRSFRIELEPSQIKAELQRFKAAVDTSIRQLHELAENTTSDSKHPIPSIFGVHELILESSFIEKIEAAIRDRFVNAEWAIRRVSDQYLDRQETVSDPHLRDKYLDIEDVANRLLTTLNGSSTAAQTDSNTVIVARELRPSVILELAKSSPAALITDQGGWTSHTSILAREFNLPMVSGIRDPGQIFSHDDQVVVDGFNGEVIMNPTLQTLDHFRSIMARRTFTDHSHDETQKGTATLDGVEIVIRANVDIPDAYGVAKHFGADGIGLFRSESLISKPGIIPSEDEQVAAYHQMAKVTGSSGVRIRTFDIGIDQLRNDRLSAERNPSLGLRSIRLSLSDSIHFRAQIRAILRAAVGQKIDLVLPMISGVGEVLRAKAIIEEERADLTNKNVLIGNPQIGVMVEVPSAVLTAGDIAQKVDFLCLGTNDLVQYLLAVDRDNDLVADWYQTLHPAVIRAISAVLAAAENAGIPLAVCGEMAGSPFYAPLLIGLGTRELSMNVNSISQIRRLISGINLSETIDLVVKIGTCETPEEIESLLREHYVENWNDLFPPGLLASRHR